MLLPNKTKSLATFILGLLVITLGISTAVQASEISLEQEGSGGEIRVTAPSNHTNYSIHANQKGLENLLDITIGSSIEASIVQNGDNGAININAEKSNNVIDVTQSGAFNDLHAILSGKSNISSISQQGNSNVLSFTFTGNNNRLTVQQSNSDNKIDFRHSGSGGTYNLNQDGTNNYLDINTQTSMHLSITQSGNGESISIQN